MDKLKAMHAFVRIADEGTLTAAARALESSLPAVVRSLAALEAELGVRLFNRTTRRVALTEDGQRYLDRCRQVLTAVDEAERTVRADAAAPSGKLVVTAPLLFGQLHVAPLVTSFLQRHPAMEVELVLLDRMVNLIEEGIDVGIRIGQLKDSSLIAVPIGHVRRVVAASPALLRKHGTPKHPRALRDANCLRTTGSTALDWSFHENGRQLKIAARGNLKVNQIAALADACAAGLGFGMFMSYQVQPYLQRGQLKLVLERFEPPPRPVQIVYPQGRLLPARAKAFVSWMRKELRESPWSSRAQAVGTLTKKSR